jgi:hypothetical protein
MRAIDTAETAPEDALMTQDDYMPLSEGLNYEAQATAGIVLVAVQDSSCKGPALQ